MPLSQNTALFSLLGAFHGGDGKSTFALLNLEGETPVRQCQGLSQADHSAASPQLPLPRSVTWLALGSIVINGANTTEHEYVSWKVYVKPVVWSVSFSVRHVPHSADWDGQFNWDSRFTRDSMFNLGTGFIASTISVDYCKNDQNFWWSATNLSNDIVCIQCGNCHKIGGTQVEPLRLTITGETKHNLGQAMTQNSATARELDRKATRILGDFDRVDEIRSFTAVKTYTLANSTVVREQTKCSNRTIAELVGLLGYNFLLESLKLEDEIFKFVFTSQSPSLSERRQLLEQIQSHLGECIHCQTIDKEVIEEGELLDAEIRFLREWLAQNQV
jgi:hypothetical protein